MQLPFINDLQDYEQVLPTSLRVNANPHYTGRGVTIAFLDSGFYPHPDLTEPFSRIICHTDATGDPSTSSGVVETPHFRIPYMTSWHGLMTSCACAGNGFMSSGLYAGIASEANLVLVKTGNRQNRRIREQDIYRSLRWVIDNAERFGVRIVNVSLGGDIPLSGRPTPLVNLVEEAVSRGLIVVAASGNMHGERMCPPASAPSAITVGGLDDHNALDRRRWTMYHSCYGTGARSVMKPELIAPAQWVAAPTLPRTAVHNEAQFLWRIERATDAQMRQILRTKYAKTRISVETLSKPLPEIRRILRQRMNDEKFIHPHYQHVDGTSFAAPIVSSVVAQLLEINPALTPRQVKKILIHSADPLDDLPLEQQGAGAVNASRAVEITLKLNTEKQRSTNTKKRSNEG
jgi:serine protease AprX